MCPPDRARLDHRMRNAMEQVALVRHDQVAARTLSAWRLWHVTTNHGHRPRGNLVHHELGRCRQFVGDGQDRRPQFVPGWVVLATIVGQRRRCRQPRSPRSRSRFARAGRTNRSRSRRWESARRRNPERTVPPVTRGYTRQRHRDLREAGKPYRSRHWRHRPRHWRK